jgi:hypothetical protein
MPAFFPITLQPDGQVGLDLDKMDNTSLKAAYQQFKTPSTDWERVSSDARQFVRICEEMVARGL